MGKLNAHDVAGYIEWYKLDTFIETGTFQGDSLRHALKYKFNKLISVELSNTHFVNAMNTFKSETRVQLIHGNSTDVIKRIDYSGFGNILFWLDAHLPQRTDDSLDVQDLDTIFPLKVELEHLLKVRGNRDVFLIDDLRLYEKHNYDGGNCDIDDVQGTLDFDAIFSATHEVKRDLRSTGYLIATPK